MVQETYILKVSALSNSIERESFQKENSLKQLQTAVGGLIEHLAIRLPASFNPAIDCYVDEEGLLKRNPVVNVRITELAQGIYPWTTIVGNAVFAKHDEEGATLGLTDEECQALEKLLKE